MNRKPTILLATLIITMGLLLGASTAQAVTVITDVDGNVTRIENLPVPDDTGDITIYNVDFVYDTAFAVYGENLDYDFKTEENVLAALEAVTDALNAEDPTPAGAGPQGTDQFFIGGDEENDLVVAAGSENIEGLWDRCETDCFDGVRALLPITPFTYADFTEAQEVAPGKATLISPSGPITENTPTYTWNAVANSTWYYLWVNDSSQEQRILKWYTAEQAGCGGGTGECSVTPSTELADGTSKWWIQTWNEFGDGPWSAGLTFTVNTGTSVPPGKATLISPSGSISESSPTYTWNAVANSTWYQLWVEDTAGNKNTPWYTVDEADCGDGTGECSVTPSTELADGSYSWWIRTYNDAGNGPWSDRMDFTVDAGTGELPGKATLISPSGTITESSPTYTWNAVENATWYYLWVNDSTQEQKILQWYTADRAGCGGGAGECSVTPSTELADGAAMWWIQTWNEFGYGPWSARMDFKVNTGTVDPGVNVETDEDGNVIRIENLLVPDDTGDIVIYNVDFVYDTAFAVYGENLDYDFKTEENVLAALEAVTDALNFNDPTPAGAGPQGTDQFFIGGDEENDLVVAAGAENIEGVWDRCETDCLDGVRVLLPSTPYTYADFTEVLP